MCAVKVIAITHVWPDLSQHRLARAHVCLGARLRGLCVGTVYVVRMDVALQLQLNATLIVLCLMRPRVEVTAMLAQLLMLVCEVAR